MGLNESLNDLHKRYGDGVIMKMSDRVDMSIETVPTGSMALDMALGVGGYPRGRIIEVVGPESAGKSTLCMHAVAEAQKAGLVCAYVDSEHAMDPKYAADIGVNLDELYISQPDFGEQALEVVVSLAHSGDVGLIVVDSVAALTPQAEIEGSVGDSHVGLQARMMSQAMRKLAGVLNRTKTTCMFVNQIREKIGVTWGSNETTPGGRALKFYSSVRLDIRRIETLKEGTEAVGNRTRVKVIKNKVAPPFTQAEFDITYGIGINATAEIVDLATDAGVLKRSGAWYSYDGDNIGQGKAKTVQALTQDLDLRDEIEEKTRAALGVRVV